MAEEPDPVAKAGESVETHLLALVHQGDQRALASLFELYSRLVYSVALRVLGDPAAAEHGGPSSTTWSEPMALCGPSRCTTGQ
jgi:hypothetical protein